MRRSLSAVLALGLVSTLGMTPAPATPTVVPMVLTPVATGLSKPVALTFRPGDNAQYVADGAGRIRVIRDGVLEATPVLDISHKVSTGLEQGLIGLAFDPADPDYLYIHYTDLMGHSHITEYQMDGGVADVQTERDLMVVNQPYANHNCGTLRFGPDGNLYICLGDGGSAGDPGNRSQNLGELLGKMLRIDPRGAIPYSIPADNPFVGVEGARGEIWSYGLRNPWGWSFDRSTGDMWIGDVGQNLWEEINFQPASSTGGENYGWKLMEGTHPYQGGQEPENHTRPIFEYPHGMGCSVTGGFVYRGTRIAGLQGTYVFGDFCSARLWTLGDVDGEIIPVPIETGVPIVSLTALGEDADGEIWAMDLTGNVFRLDPVLPS
jgi:glucose/arabinose dehydrogenase